MGMPPIKTLAWPAGRMQWWSLRKTGAPRSPHTVQQHFQHEFAAHISQQQQHKTGQRPTHRQAAAQVQQRTQPGVLLQQLLGLLQRDARFIDFVQEDIGVLQGTYMPCVRNPQT